MDTKYTKSWETYKEACGKGERPIPQDEEAYMKPVIESYDATMLNFIIALFL
ncbi:MAG: hypothetical protein RR310_07995 [Eubacterium sp.]